jgi:hypothetical protein
VGRAVPCNEAVVAEDRGTEHADEGRRRVYAEKLEQREDAGLGHIDQLRGPSQRGRPMSGLRSKCIRMRVLTAPRSEGDRGKKGVNVKAEREGLFTGI